AENDWGKVCSEHKHMGLPCGTRLHMKVRVSLIVVALRMSAVAESVPRAATLQAPAPAPSAASAQRALLKQYCFTCHNERLKTAGLTLESIDLENIAHNAETWEKVVRKLRTGTMPPVGVRRPDEAGYEALIGWLETELDRAEAAQSNPGRPLIHRLNRTEYANAIRDLLALEIGDVASLLPADDSSYGFDNIADVLGVSPLLQERYLAAADRISALAVGDTEIAPGSDTLRLRQELSQDKHIEGLTLGTVGGILVRYTFPLDAECTIEAKLVRTAGSQRESAHRNGDDRGAVQPHGLRGYAKPSAPLRLPAGCWIEPYGGRRLCGPGDRQRRTPGLSASDTGGGARPTARVLS